MSNFILFVCTKRHNYKPCIKGVAVKIKCCDIDMYKQLQADEYVVFSPHQQRMRYLVEFTLPDQDSGVVASDDTVGVVSEAVDGEDSGEELPEEGTHLTHTYIAFSQVNFAVLYILLV